MRKGKLQARLERAEAIIIARRQALVERYVNWVFTGSLEQQAAIWRLDYTDGGLSGLTPEHCLDLCGGRLEWADADKATVAAFLQTMPPDLAAEAKALQFVFTTEPATARR